MSGPCKIFSGNNENGAHRVLRGLRIEEKREGDSMESLCLCIAVWGGENNELTDVKGRQKCFGKVSSQ